MTAINDPRCVGCKFRHDPNGKGWCYMFNEAPVRLPCAQHDKYVEKRKEIAEAIKRNPALLRDLVNQAMRDA